MKFQNDDYQDEIEVNFIPLVDVLLVIIIFLVVSTTFTKLSELKIKLPTAVANPQDSKLLPINVTVSKDGQYSINSKKLTSGDIKEISKRLLEISNNQKDIPVVINADALATHQSVINVMEAARLAGLTKLTFATQIK